MSFSMLAERQNKFFFLDIKVICEHGKFTTTVYHKIDFSDGYSNFECFYLLYINLVCYTP